MSAQAGRLRELGWFDFVNFDAPSGEDPVLISYNALLYLSVNTGKWNQQGEIIAAIFDFLFDETKIIPSEDQQHKLADLPASAPVSEVKIKSWFDRTYSP